MNPTCHHPECHTTHTASYAYGAVTGTVLTDWSKVARPVHCTFDLMPEWDRLCRIHARQKYRVSLG